MFFLYQNRVSETVISLNKHRPEAPNLAKQGEAQDGDNWQNVAAIILAFLGFPFPCRFLGYHDPTCSLKDILARVYIYTLIHYSGINEVDKDIFLPLDILGSCLGFLTMPNFFSKPQFFQM